MLTLAGNLLTGMISIPDLPAAETLVLSNNQIENLHLGEIAGEECEVKFSQNSITQLSSADLASVGSCTVRVEGNHFTCPDLCWAKLSTQPWQITEWHCGEAGNWEELTAYDLRCQGMLYFPHLAIFCNTILHTYSHMTHILASHEEQSR